MDYIVLLLLIIFVVLACIIRSTFSKRVSGSGEESCSSVPPLKYIMYDGEIKHFNNIDDDKIDSNTRFRIGSVTKVITAVCLDALAKEGLIDLDKPIKDYLSVSLKDVPDDVTVLNVINHKSGLTRNGDNFMKFMQQETPSKAELSKWGYKYKVTPDDTATKALKLYENEELFVNKKGEHNYSNLGYIMLGHVIENVTNMSYFEAFDKYIFKPANMTPSLNPDVKIYEKYDFTGYKPASLKWFDGGWATTCGALCCSLNDLLKFIEFVNKQDLLNKRFYFMRDGILLRHQGGKPNGTDSSLIYQKGGKTVIMLFAMSVDNSSQGVNTFK